VKERALPLFFRPSANRIFYLPSVFVPLSSERMNEASASFSKLKTGLSASTSGPTAHSTGEPVDKFAGRPQVPRVSLTTGNES